MNEAKRKMKKTSPSSAAPHRKEKQHIHPAAGAAAVEFSFDWAGFSSLRPAAHFSFFSRRIESLQLLLFNFSFDMAIPAPDGCRFITFHLLPFIKI